MSSHREIDALWRFDGLGLPSFHPIDPAERSLGRVGMWLFLLSLTMFFGASLMGYLAIRLGSATAPAWGFFHVPWLCYVSTPVLLGAGVSLEAAARARTRAARRAGLVGACLLSVLFVAIQTPALGHLIEEHRLASADHHVGLYGLIFTLVALHAVHVIGGMAPLGLLTFRECVPGRRRRVVSASSIRIAAIYWHFLDVVWLTMLAVFVLTR